MALMLEESMIGFEPTALPSCTSGYSSSFAASHDVAMQMVLNAMHCTWHCMTRKQSICFNVYPLLKHSVSTPLSATVKLFQHFSQQLLTTDMLTSLSETVNHMVNTSATAVDDYGRSQDRSTESCSRESSSYVLRNK